MVASHDDAAMLFEYNVEDKNSDSLKILKETVNSLNCDIGGQPVLGHGTSNRIFLAVH